MVGAGHRSRSCTPVYFEGSFAFSTFMPVGQSGFLPTAAEGSVPVPGLTVLPSTSSRFHSASLYWLLSVVSPVFMTKSIFGFTPPLARLGGLVEKALNWRIIASSSCGFRASPGRQAEVKAPPRGSRNSTRSGLSSSASWKSVIWPK